MRRVTPQISRRLAIIAWPAFVLFLVLVSVAARDECPLKNRAGAGACCHEAARAVAFVGVPAATPKTESTAPKTERTETVAAPKSLSAAQRAVLAYAPKTSPPA